MNKQFFCIALALVTFLYGAASFAGTTATINITSSGQNRQFIAYVPDSYNAATPTPLLFMMHGLTSSASAAANPNGPYRWQDLADQESFIVLFPNSYQDDSWDMNTADADFVRDMIEWSSNNYNIRTTHIFSTGHSMGAFFSYYVAKTLRNDLNKVSVFSEFAGGLVAGVWPTPVPGSATPLKGLLLHSSGDSVVPYASSQALDNNLVSQGHLSQLITLPAGLGHNWDRNYNQTQWDFFMANAPSPTPVPMTSPVGIFSLVGLCIGFGLLELRSRSRL